MGNAFLDKIDANWKELERKDKEAKKKGKLVGRFITEPYADGSAVYRIIKETKNSVRIKVVRDVGDDWEIPYWGEETTIKKSYALHSIQGREAIARIFSKPREKKKLKKVM